MFNVIIRNNGFLKCNIASICNDQNESGEQSAQMNSNTFMQSTSHNNN